MKPVNDSRDAGCHPFSADRPIEARSEDLLGRAQFAEALAEAIGAWRERDSLVIALYGGWGSGKTSIKNMALEALRESSPRVHAVEFNPWEWSGQERLFEAFFAEIGTAVGKIPGAGSQRLRRWAEKWQAYGAYLQAGAVLTGGLRRLVTIALLLLSAGWLLPGILGTTSFSPLLTSVGVFIALLAAFLQFGGDLSSRMADALLLSSVQSALTLADMKLELRRVLQTSQQTIVVVIDDIDRLPADHILSLFQLVKANADFPGLVYVLLFEKTLVDVLSTGGQITPDFIEKIVQVGFDVPVIERSRLEGVLFTELSRMLAVPAAENKFQQDRWQALFVEGLRPYLNTLRQVKRFTSSLSFNMALLSRTGTLEVNVVDLIGLEALRVFEIDLYRRLPRSKPVLTGEDPFYEFLGDDADQRKRAVIQQLLCLASEDRRGAAKAILGELFPDVKRLTSDFGFAAGDQDAWARQARICSPRFFDKYFQLSIAQHDLPLQELEDVLSAIGNKDVLVSKLAGLRDRSLLETTIDRLDPYKESIRIEHAVSFLTALFTVSEWFEDRDRGFFELDPVARASRIINRYLRQEINPAARGNIVLEAASGSSGLRLPMHIAMIDEQRRERNGGQESLMDDASLSSLKQLCVRRIRKAAEDGGLEKQRGLLGTLYRWMEWAGAEEPRKWLGSLLSTSDGVIRFLVAVTTPYRVNGAERWKIRLKYIEDVADLEPLRTAVDAGFGRGLNEEEARAVHEFHRALRRRSEGKSDDHLLGEDEGEVRRTAHSWAAQS